MRYQRGLTIVLLAGLGFCVFASLGSAASGVPGERPVAVSPGSETGLRIGDACPTFSWGSVSAARSYELVVYRLGEGGEEAMPELQARLAGSATSWTPSLDRCLERGGRYAWVVRSLGEGAASEWSLPSLFQVAAGPSEAEFEEAVAVVRSYLGARGESVQKTAHEEDSGSPSESRRRTAEIPESAAPAATQLSVDGNVDATSFTGDGTNLTGIATDTELNGHELNSSAHHVPTTYDATDFVPSNQSCANGQLVTGHDKNGVPLCAVPAGDDLGNHAATTSLDMNGLDVNEASRLHLTTTTNRITRANQPAFGQAATFDPSALKANGLIIEHGETESAGLYLDGDTAVLWSPGDGGGVFRVYDEDSFASGPIFTVNNDSTVTGEHRSLVSGAVTGYDDDGSQDCPANRVARGFDADASIDGFLDRIRLNCAYVK